MQSPDPAFHVFTPQPRADELPTLFTCPFYYEPHPLSIRACAEVQTYLAERTDWASELSRGKMFGVLIVERNGEYGFLAAYSGILDGKNDHEYFVPPVFDLLQPQGYFKTEETAISEINTRIKALIEDNERLSLLQKINSLIVQKDEALSQHKSLIKMAKKQRDERRRAGVITIDAENALIKESQYLKAELKRIEQYWSALIEEVKEQLNQTDILIEQLKRERKLRSAALQNWLFRQFKMLNAFGKEKDLVDIFTAYGHPIPPSGSGECAAPKLLQYAYKHLLRPIAMAEFWWGDSPKNEIRRHGAFYPSCKTKCEPILRFMLQGLNVEPNPQEISKRKQNDIEIIYEDEWIAAINKPSGMLSVPGKDDSPSVLTWARKQFPNADGPLLVHRLDMDTSGILLIAKSKDIHQKLQQLFESREIKKSYTAILSARIEDKEGFIRLPLCVNPDNRPFQMVSSEWGKPAVTRYRVEMRDETSTLIRLYPLTGRTHQLRVHCAHHEGLNAPIKGDNLYGTPSDRLYLHADTLEFRHPANGTNIRIESPIPF